MAPSRSHRDSDTPHHFTTALRLITFGIVPVRPLISHPFMLDEVREAFDTTAQRRGLKTMVLPAGTAGSDGGAKA